MPARLVIKDASSNGFETFNVREDSYASLVAFPLAIIISASLIKNKDSAKDTKLNDYTAIPE